MLASDAATCGVIGVLVFASGLVSGITLIPVSRLFRAGLVLLPIVAFMAVFARATMVPAWAVQVIVLGHALGLLGCVALPALGLISPNAFGWLVLLAQAVIVAVFAGLEWSARPRLTATARLGPEGYT